MCRLLTRSPRCPDVKFNSTDPGFALCTERLARRFQGKQTGFIELVLVPPTQQSTRLEANLKEPQENKPAKKVN